MGRRIGIRLQGDTIPLETLIEAFRSINSLLHELDHITSGHRTLEWDVSDLAYGSAVMAVEPRLIDLDAPDKSEEVMDMFQDGIQTLEADVPTKRPERYTDKALEFLRGFPSVLDKGITRFTCTISREEKAPISLPITQRIAASVDEILGATRVSFGSVEGTVELLSALGYGKHFDIVDRVTGRKIRCESDGNTLAKIAAESWEQNIVVTGERTLSDFIWRPNNAQESPKNLLGFIVLHYNPKRGTECRNMRIHPSRSCRWANRFESVCSHYG
jgi:hypothetical protein